MRANDRIPRFTSADAPHGVLCFLLFAFAFALVFSLFGCSPATQGSSASASSTATVKAVEQDWEDAAEGSVDDEAGESGEGESDSTDESGESASTGDSGTATSVVLNDNNLVDPTQRADNSFIYDTTIESLFDQSSLYDNRTVQVVGEVIGDRISADDGTDRCWVMLTSLDVDNASSISVILSAEQASQIDHYGRYGVTGTTLQVRGTYHQACPDHDGIPDVHATASSVIAKGVEHPDNLSPGEFLPGLVTIIIGLALLGIFYFARERMR